MSNTDPTKKYGGNQVLANGQQFLFLIRHPPCCLCMQSSSVKVLAVIEKKTSKLKVKDPLSFEIWIFRNGQTDRDDDRRIYVAMSST